MARYTGPVWKVSRRLGFSILESGKELNKRAYETCAWEITTEVEE